MIVFLSVFHQKHEKPSSGAAICQEVKKCFK